MLRGSSNRTGCLPRDILVQVSELNEEFSNLPQRFDLDIVYLPIEEILRYLLLLILLLGGVRLVGDPSSIGEGVVHRQLLSELPDLLLVLFDQ